MLASLLGASAAADTVVLSASKDNTLYQSATGTLSNGAGHSLFVGIPNSGGVRRAIVRFDLSAIPMDATVDSVTVRLFMSRTRNGDQTTHLHRVLADWGEGASNAGGNEGSGATAQPGDATWLHRFYPDQFWTAPGGDFNPTPSASITVGSGQMFYEWSTPALADDVRAFIAAPATNFGWIVIGNEQTQPSSKRLESRESDVPEYAPQLVVNYTPAGAVTGACCVGQVCVRTSASSCAAQGGIYRGDNVACGSVACGDPVGACCMHDGSCTIMTSAECAAAGGMYAGDNTQCAPGVCTPILTPFVDPLPLPSVAQPVSGQPGGAAHYEIPVRRITAKLHRDLPLTTMYGYAGQYPGPTIEATVGQPVTVTWINDLRDDGGQLLMEHDLHVDTCLHGPDHHGTMPRTVTHLHGAHTDQVSDGYPEFTQDPGEASPPYIYPNDLTHQPAATLWYHDHALGITRLNVYMGLGGFYMLRDPAENAFNLPAGEFEVPLLLQDKSFNHDGSLRYPMDWHEHFFGDTIVVNGIVWPYMDVKRGRYRFRIANGSGSRFYNLSLSNGSPITQIGGDQGLLAAPYARSSIFIAPGERMDVVIDFSAFPGGSEVMLVNSAPAPFPGPAGVGVIPNVMKFRVIAATGHTAALPTSFRPITRLQESNASAARSFSLAQGLDPCTGSRWLIGDLGWDDVTDFPYLGTTEVWSFINRSGTSHPMHLHHSPFQVLDRQTFQIINGQVTPTGSRVPAPAYEQGWKDTVRVDPGQIVRVISRFEDFTGLFPFHCHILEHEDNEMMRQMQVVPCPADFDQNGGVDGADVEAFYTTWQTGESIADLNYDGGVDGGDVETFYRIWEAGGC
ncbi:MAG: multicopper oxidase family protein [Planctomycetes bacterium]|nr:multicopper oxidase family protein [Planctomycetota bacterium]